VVRAVHTRFVVRLFAVDSYSVLEHEVSAVHTRLVNVVGAACSNWLS
jgi:hypothetical protein